MKDFVKAKAGPYFQEVIINFNHISNFNHMVLNITYRYVKGKSVYAL